MMVKRLHKRSPRCEKDRMGCMWGLFSLLDFRNGRSTRRLISDLRRVSSRSPGGTGNSKRSVGLLINGENKCEDLNTDASDLYDGDGRQITRIESVRTSVKALMEEEMSEVTHSKKQSAIAVEDCSGRNKKQINKTCKVPCDQQSFRSLESHSSIETFPEIKEFCCQNHQHLEMYVNEMNGTDSFHCQKSATCVEINEPDISEMQLLTKQAILEKKEGEAIEAFLIEKFIDAKQIFRDDSLIQSKEFMDALEILNLNKELFLKLMQDPNSVLVKRIQELQNAQEGVELLDEENHDSAQCGEIVVHKQSRIQSFFRRKDKAKGKESDGSQASNRIVVLKPSYASIQNSTSVTSQSSSLHFSLREIKRKWKHVIGESRKDRHRISMDGILHKIPYGHQDQEHASKELESKTSCRNERTSKPSTSKKKDKIHKQKACKPSTEHEVALPSLDSHLNTMTDNQRGSNIYKEAKKHLAEMLNIGDENGESPANQIPRTLGRILSLPEYMSPRTSPVKDEEPSFLPEQIGCSQNDNFQYESENELLFQEEVAANQDSSEENQQLDSPSSSISGSPLHNHKIEDSDGIGEKTERPSPVSILEQFYVEDVINHRSHVAHLDELPMQPRQINFEEPDDSALTVTTLDPEIYPRTCMAGKQSELEYVKAILEASGPSCEEFMGSLHSSDQPLNSSLFEEVEASSTQSSNDRKLLFDCTNEVLMDVYERFFGCSPWVSFVKSNIRPMPPRNYAFQEVRKGIEWHLLQQVPFTLDQIVGKDMAKSGRWMDFRFDVEGIGIDIGDDVLEELLEETIHEVLN